MKTKMKLLIMIFMSVFIMAGCGEKEELETIPQGSLEDIINTDEEVDEEGCPEGYVYDYQVSMEPIPEEIAALGGEVCGTIHAYPTKIKIALAKQEIEKDAELKAQNEKNIKAIKDYLAKTYEGEFEVEPFSLKYEYMCTELDSEKMFEIFIYPSYLEGINDDVVHLDMYDYLESGEKYKENLSYIIEKNIQEEYVYDVFCETDDSFYNKTLNLYIAVFSEVKPDCMEKQRNIIEIYSMMKAIQEEDSNLKLRIVVTYFPQIYKDVISSQYQSKCLNNYICIINEKAKKLYEIGEVYEQFEYSESFFWDEENNLDDIVANKEEYYENEYILPYWRGIE